MNKTNMKYLSICSVFILTSLGIQAQSSESILIEEFKALERHISNMDVVNVEVSEASVAWHLDHSLKVVLQIANAVVTSSEEDYNPHFSISKFYVQTTGNIPRGRAKAPESVKPPAIIVLEDLEKQLVQAKQLANDLINAERKQFFPHPVFGDMKKRQAIRFICIHTRHHLDIIEDIVKD